MEKIQYGSDPSAFAVFDESALTIDFPGRSYGKFFREDLDTVEKLLGFIYRVAFFNDLDSAEGLRRIIKSAEKIAGFEIPPFVPA